jgi:SAM-dependent methyltransferase
LTHLSFYVIHIAELSVEFLLSKPKIRRNNEMRKQKDIFIAFVTFLLVIFSWSNGMSFAFSDYSYPDIQEKKKGDHQQRSSADRMYRFEQLEVVVDDFDAEGYILDIGGGGEGIIGLLKGPQVIAIDINKRELEEAPPGPLKIVMDARDLKFLDQSFRTATVFFTFMYIKNSDHQEVFEELHRVLEPGGRLLIWDVVFPKRMDEKKEVAIFPLKIKLPEKDISTGYGVNWPEKERGLSHYIQLAENIGFAVDAQKDHGSWFFLELKKRNK